MDINDREGEGEVYDVYIFKLNDYNNELEMKNY